MLLLAFALPFAFQTMERARHWKSYEALIESDLRNSPGYYAPAAMKVFEVQLKHGLLPDAKKTASAITAPGMQNIVTGLVQTEYAVTNAISIGNPQDAMDSLLDFGTKLKRAPPQAQWDPTLNHIWRAYQYTFAMQLGELGDKFPQNAKLRYKAGVYLLIAKRNVEAINHLRAAGSSPLLSDSLRGKAFYYLGRAMVDIGYAAMAETHMQNALQQQLPDLRAHCTLATVYKQANTLEDERRRRPPRGRRHRRVVPLQAHRGRGPAQRARGALPVPGAGDREPHRLAPPAVHRRPGPAQRGRVRPHARDRELRQRGTRFESYCATRVHGAILDELRAQDWVPRLVRNRAVAYRDALNALRASLDREPSTRELAIHLGTTDDEVNALRARAT